MYVIGGKKILGGMREVGEMGGIGDNKQRGDKLGWNSFAKDAEPFTCLFDVPKRLSG